MKESLKKREKGDTKIAYLMSQGILRFNSQNNPSNLKR